MEKPMLKQIKEERDYIMKDYYDGVPILDIKQIDWLIERVDFLESRLATEEKINKDIHKLSHFLADNPNLSKNRFGEPVSLIALDALKELKKENKRLNMIIGKYAGKMSEIATFNDAVSKEIRKISKEMITS